MELKKSNIKLGKSNNTEFPKSNNTEPEKRAKSDNIKPGKLYYGAKKCDNIKLGNKTIWNQ